MGAWSMTPPGEVHEVDTAEGTAYERFKPGLDFAEVATELAQEARDVWEREGRRMFVTRRTVLGRMHQLKQAAWRAHNRHLMESDHMPDLPATSAWQPGDIF